MWLAALRGKYPAELRADFRQYYHVSADDIGNGISVAEAADLAAMLPVRSRCMSAEKPELSWDVDHYLLAKMSDTLAYLFWLNTEDGVEGVNRPSLIPRPGDTNPSEPESEPERQRLTVDECAEILSRKRVDLNGN